MFKKSVSQSKNIHAELNKFWVGSAASLKGTVHTEGNCNAVFAKTHIFWKGKMKTTWPRLKEIKQIKHRHLTETPHRYMHITPCLCVRRCQRSWEKSLLKAKFHLGYLPWSLALRWRKQQNFLFFLSSFSKSANVTPSGWTQAISLWFSRGQQEQHNQGSRTQEAPTSSGSDTQNLKLSIMEIYRSGYD